MTRITHKLKVSPTVQHQIPSYLRDGMMKTILEGYYKWAERELALGGIDFIRITNAGQYATAPTVTITGTNTLGQAKPGVDNSGIAVGEAVLNDLGGVAYVKLTSNGYGYETATVTFSAGVDGQTATGECVITNAYGGIQERLAKLLDLRDVDEAEEEVLQYIRKEFLATVPTQNNAGLEDSVTERLLVKTIRDFYLARGAEKSFKLLFRLMFEPAQSDVTISYPYPKNVNYLTVGGQFVARKFLRLKRNNYVDSITLTNPGNPGDYASPPAITLTGGSGTKAAASCEIDPITGLVTSIKIVNPGHNYTGAPSVSFASGAAAATTTIRTSASQFFEECINKTVTGLRTGATARITSYYIVDDSGVEYIHAFIEDVLGEFESGEEIQFEKTGGGFEEAEIISVASRYVIVNGGTGFVHGNSIDVAAHNGGSGLRVNVDQVSSPSGELLSITIVDPGIDYVVQPQLDLTGTGASVDVITAGTGYEQRRVPSNAATGTDLNDRTKEYTYNIISSQPIGNYRNRVKSLVHPAGMNFLGIVQFISAGSSGQGNPFSMVGDWLNSYANRGGIVWRRDFNIVREIPREFYRINTDYWYWYLDGEDVDDSIAEILASMEYSDVIFEVTYGTPSGVFVVGDSVQGNTSGAVGTVIDLTSGKLYIQGVTAPPTFEVGETIQKVGNPAISGVVTAVTVPNISLPLEYFQQFDGSMQIISVDSNGNVGAIISISATDIDWMNNTPGIVTWTNVSSALIGWH